MAKTVTRPMSSERGHMNERRGKEMKIEVFYSRRDQGGREGRRE